MALRKQLDHLEVLWIKRLQILWDKEPIFPDQFTIKPNLAAAPFLALDEHHVPVDGGTIAVIALLISLTRREVQRAANFFIEQNIAHRVHHIRIEPERKLADVARAGIGIENLVEAFGVAAGSLDDFAVLEFQLHVFKLGACVERRCVVLKRAVDGIFYGARKHFAIGNVAIARARDGGHPFDAETQIGAGRFEVHVLGFGHSLDERLHGLGHSAVVEGAHVEIKILERLGAHIGRLRHTRRGPAQHDPTSLVHAIV